MADTPVPDFAPLIAAVRDAAQYGTWASKPDKARYHLRAVQAVLEGLVDWQWLEEVMVEAMDAKYCHRGNVLRAALLARAGDSSD